jgi:hypothetical protein
MAEGEVIIKIKSISDGFVYSIEPDHTNRAWVLGLIESVRVVERAKLIADAFEKGTKPKTEPAKKEG